MDAEGNTTELLQEQTEIAGTELTEVGTEPDGNRGIALLLLFFVFIMIAINGISLAAFTVEKRLRGYNNYFIINLTLSDFIFGFFLVITCLHMYLGRLPFPFPVRCKVFYGVSNSIQFVSNLIIVTICVDRHRAIYDPIGYFTRRRKRTALYINICVWIVSLVFWFSFSTVPDYFLQFRLGSECLHWYSVFPIAHFSTVLIRFIIPFTITLILYIRIFIKIRGIAGGKHIDQEFTEDTTVSDHSLAEDDVKENKQRPQVKTISSVDVEEFPICSGTDIHVDAFCASAKCILRKHEEEDPNECQGQAQHNCFTPLLTGIEGSYQMFQHCSKLCSCNDVTMDQSWGAYLLQEAKKYARADQVKGFCQDEKSNDYYKGR
nr:D(2) dopamine receptor A-like [Lytechinus pictus]